MSTQLVSEQDIQALHDSMARYPTMVIIANGVKTGLQELVGAAKENIGEYTALIFRKDICPVTFGELSRHYHPADYNLTAFFEGMNADPTWERFQELKLPLNQNP